VALSAFGRTQDLSRPTAGVSAAQPANGRWAGYQASTQLDPVVIEARSAEENHGGLGPGR